MSKFGALKTDRTRVAAVPATNENRAAPVGQGASAKSASRDGKKAVSAYFSPAVSQGLNILALEQGLSLQALLGEAFDDVMRKYGKHPFGER